MPSTATLVHNIVSATSFGEVGGIALGASALLPAGGSITAATQAGGFYSTVTLAIPAYSTSALVAPAQPQTESDIACVPFIRLMFVFCTLCRARRVAASRSMLS